MRKWTVYSLRNKKKVLLCMLAVLLCLSACTGKNPSDPVTTADPTSTGSGTESTADEVDPAATGHGDGRRINWAKLLMQDEPVKELHCLEHIGYADALWPVSGNRVAAEIYDESASPVFYIIDVWQDQILYQSDSLSGEIFLGQRTNGDYIFYTYINSEYRIYDSSFTYQYSIDFPGGTPEYDPKHDVIYYLRNDELGCISFDGTREVLFTPDPRVELMAFDPERGLVVMRGFSAEEPAIYDYSIYSLAQGEYLWDRQGDYIEYNFAGDQLISQANEEEYIHAGDDPDGTMITHRYVEIGDAVTGQPEQTYQMPEDGYCEIMGASGYGITNVYEDVDYDGEDPTEDDSWMYGAKMTFYLTDLVHGRAAELTEYVGRPEYMVQTCLPDMDCVLTAPMGPEKGRMYLLYPEGLTDWSPLESYVVKGPEPAKQYVLGDSLARERSRADDIEQKYGISFLIGNECLNAPSIGTYEMISVEDPDYPAGEWDFDTDHALDVIDRALELYPETYFDKFKNYRGEGGLRFLLVKDLINLDGSFEAAGLFYDTNAWYNIVLDVDDLYDTDTVHHEMWHAIEQLITDMDYMAFDPADWNPMNPSGFYYEEDFDNYYNSEGLEQYIIPWDYEQENVNDVYFASIYGTVTAYEDRATIVENLLMEGYEADYYGFPTPQERIMHYPHLRAKTDYMAYYVRVTFGEVYWE